jgi:hypothetical protein
VIAIAVASGGVRHAHLPEHHGVTEALLDGRAYRQGVLDRVDDDDAAGRIRTDADNLLASPVVNARGRSR